MKALLSKLFGVGTPKHRSTVHPVDPTQPFVVNLYDDRLVVHRPDGQREELAWDALERVVVRVSDRAPWTGTPWLILAGDAQSQQGCVVPMTAANHDALGAGPCLGLEKPPRHIGQFLGKFLDRAMHQRGGGDIVADQRLVEFALADIAGGFLAQGIVAVLLQRLSQVVQYLAEGSLAGAIPEKAFLVLQFDVETVDFDRWQAGGAVVGDARGGDDIFCHLALPCGFRWRQRPGNPLVSREGANSEWRSANGGALTAPHSPFPFGLKSCILGQFLSPFALTHGVLRL